MAEKYEPSEMQATEEAMTPKQKSMSWEREANFEESKFDEELQKALTEEEDAELPFRRAQLRTGMLELQKLDFEDPREVVEWFDKIAPAAGNDKVIDQNTADKIVAEFGKHGYLPGENTGKNFNENNTDNYTHYLVGQALKGLGDMGGIDMRGWSMFMPKLHEKLYPEEK